MTNWFEQYYTELLDYAASIVFKKEIPVDPADLVNDAYIKFVESGCGFDFIQIKKYISSGGYNEFNHIRGKSNFGDKIVERYSEKGDKVCAKCKELKPIGAFRAQKMNGWTYSRVTCLDCEREWGRLWKKGWLSKENNRVKWNAYVRQWQKQRGIVKETREEYYKRIASLKKPIHELWKKANKKYQAKQKDNLTDQYIKHLLKCGRKDFSPAAIEKKREELMAKRRLANSIAKNAA